MFIHPYIASQVAREHRRDMLAEVSQRQLRRQRGHQATRNANAASRIIRRVATAIAGVGIAALTNSHRAPLGRWRQWSQPQASRPASRNSGNVRMGDGLAAAQRT